MQAILELCGSMPIWQVFEGPKITLRAGVGRLSTLASSLSMVDRMGPKEPWEQGSHRSSWLLAPYKTEWPAQRPHGSLQGSLSIWREPLGIGKTRSN